MVVTENIVNKNIYIYTMEERITALVEHLESLELEKAILQDQIDDVKKELKELLDGKS